MNMHINEENLRAEILLISGADPKRCMKCGKCSASCPSANFMDILPHRFVRSVRDGSLFDLMEANTIWLCLSCFICTERCPRDVEPAKLIEAVRCAVTRRQNGNHINPDDFLEIIENDEDIPAQLIVSALRKYSG